MIYESVTVIAPSDDEYSDYLEDYKQGKEIDSWKAEIKQLNHKR